MREFKILPKIQDFELNMIEKLLGEGISIITRAYIKKYGGDSVLEKYFEDKFVCTKWELSQFLFFKDMYNLTQEFSEVYKRKLVPFAYDPGGWHFCLCMDEKDFGCIIVNRWTDYSEEEQFLKIADSFEEFIDGLQAEE